MMQGASVSLGGSLLNDAILERVTVQQRLNDHSFCEIECRSTMDRPIPGEDAMGTDCVIQNQAEDGTPHLSFSGTVIEVTLRHQVEGWYTCVLRAASPSWLLDLSPRNAYFPGSLQQVAGSMGAVSMLQDKPEPHEYVQFGETDWRFLLRLADDHGGWIRTAINGTELLKEFDAPRPLTYRDHYGLLEFHIAGSLAPAKVAAVQYDRALNQSSVIPGESRFAEFESPGQQMAAAVQRGSAEQSLSGFASRSRQWTNPAMQDRAQSEAERAQGAAVTAGGVSRDTTLTAGGSVEIANLGDANGLWHLTSVTHHWTNTEYENTFEATPWQMWRGARPPPRAIAPGVQVARVVSNVDPEQRGRLAVSLFWQNGVLLLAPITSLHCGAGFGLALMPEVGDEVLVAFEEADPERPVILGSLWNAVHPPPAAGFHQPGETNGSEFAGNNLKRLVTKSGNRIHISDTPGKESISFATPRSNHLLFSEHVTETARPVIALHTTGDIVLRARGRIHSKSTFHSVHVDGKEKKSVSVRMTDWYGNSAPYHNVTLSAELTSGTTSQQPMTMGQHFTGIPPGSNKFTFPDFYENYKAESGEGDV